MPSEEENIKTEKARFYYETVVKAEEILKWSYEKIHSKISLFIGILSAVIPLLTGAGYVLLSNVTAVLFFIFYVISLFCLVIALAICVHLLAPIYFKTPDFGEFVKEYDEKSLEFIIFKISHSWEDMVNENSVRIKSLHYRLQRTVQLIIIGLVALVFSFVLQGMEYFIIEPYAKLLSASSWQLLVICFGVFGIIASLIIKYTSMEDAPSCVNVNK
jgi:hypothetical protein